MNSKKLLIFWGLVILAVVAGVFYFVAGGETLVDSRVQDANKATGEDRIPLTGELTDLIIGDHNAPVTIEEFSDFKCPNCAKYHKTAYQEIKENYIDTGKANVAFRAYPGIGPDAGRALLGAYCSNEQGLFTQYHDAIFGYMWENHYKNGDEAAQIEDILTDELLGSVVENIGGNKTEFIGCLNAPDMRYNVENDLIRGADYSVQGTPTNVIGGKKIVGNQPYSIYKTVIEINL